MFKIASASIVTAAFSLLCVPTARAAAATYTADFESPIFSTGSINGQDGWTVSNPNFNQAVVNGVAHSGTQSWKRANTYGTGSYGDQPYSAPLPGAAASGEATTVGATSNTNSYSVWFKAGTPSADGSFVSLSLSNSGGARMNWVGLDNSGAGGLKLTAEDTVSNGFGNSASFNEYDLTTVNRTDWHQLTVNSTFNNGVGNDVVQYYVDGTLFATLGSWEDYYRNDPGEVGGGNLVSASDRVLFRTSSGVADPTAAGFYFDDFSISTAVPEPTTLAFFGLGAIGLLARRRRAVVA